MRYCVYLRDWYYNSGIVGFINVLGENEININKIKKDFDAKLEIGENYIEFSTDILNDFYEKYKKQVFDIFFDIDNYKERIDRLIEKIKNSSGKIPKKLLQETALSGKVVNSFIEEVVGKDLNKIFSGQNVLKEITNVKKELDKFKNNNDVYFYLKQKNSNFIDYFLNNEVDKRICSYQKVKEYIDKLNADNSPKNKSQQCYICGHLKKSYDFSNAITQVLGFNSDNSNWIWGFKGSKVKICPLCALIYTCAVPGMVFIKRNIKGEYKTFFYALNRNTNLETLFNTFWLFKNRIEEKENQEKPFYTIVNEITLEIVKNKAEAFFENINFIEMAENSFGGQGTKSYNVYNYNITPDLAGFIKSLEDGQVPRGGYILNDIYYDIAEEILKKTVDMTLNYSDLSRYFDYYIRSLELHSKYKVRYSIYTVMKYILKYILKLKGGNMEEQAKIVGKAFGNGREVAQKIQQENKIKGIAYQLLNDLKIADRNSFMDKYLRLSMSYGLEIKLGGNKELTDLDNFMSFGYAFVNGLLAKSSNLNKEEE
ncbi:type I-B CRISPR-associated protein Cas8b1/Cst1 [Spirochaetia bacterium 38H-sp]|uniref:Type I-B CRISPR-associated protein Cas8b1/Cst1 n=1 Tax=Rarispira pelagica TaxID=3141764 RepID=A0ABU9UBD1_9SPIR